MTTQCFTIYAPSFLEIISSKDFLLFKALKNMQTKADLTINIDRNIFDETKLDGNYNITLPKGLWEFTLQFDVEARNTIINSMVTYKPNIKTFVNNVIINDRPTFNFSGYPAQCS